MTAPDVETDEGRSALLATTIRSALTKVGDAHAGELVYIEEHGGWRFAVDTPLGSFVIEVMPT